MPAVTINDQGQVILQNPDLITQPQWQRINDLLRKMGYDRRGWEDTKKLMSHTVGKPIQEDQAQVVKRVLNLLPKKPRKQLTPHEKHMQSLVRKKGYTNDFRLGGYIFPNGGMLDMSGGQGQRMFDHRQIGTERNQGGLKGMQQFIAGGAIRIMPESGSIDIRKAPTENQIRTLMQFIRQYRGKVTVDMDAGLGEYNESDDSFYRSPRFIAKQYPLGTNPSIVINDIRSFYSSPTQAALWVRSICKFAQVDCVRKLF